MLNLRIFCNSTRTSPCSRHHHLSWHVRQCHFRRGYGRLPRGYHICRRASRVRHPGSQAEQFRWLGIVHTFNCVGSRGSAPSSLLPAYCGVQGRVLMAVIVFFCVRRGLPVAFVRCLLKLAHYRRLQGLQEIGLQSRSMTARLQEVTKCVSSCGDGLSHFFCVYSSVYVHHFSEQGIGNKTRGKRRLHTQEIYGFGPQILADKNYPVLHFQAFNLYLKYVVVGHGTFLASSTITILHQIERKEKTPLVVMTQTS